jgi:predicted HNH restriction endonuclease
MKAGARSRQSRTRVGQRRGLIVSPDEVRAFFDQLSYKSDDRYPPDNYRKGKFREGWEDATLRNHSYADETLERLHWQKLGNQFGQHFRQRKPEEIDEVFEILATLYRETRSLPGEIRDREHFVEGAVLRISVNSYERRPEARRRRIDHYGARCFICGFDFGTVYGPIGQGFIHVPHSVPLSEIQREYNVDPVADLRPVCPNCHAVLHLGTEALTIDRVRELLDRAKERRRK